ncbi:transhypothetical protein [Limosa lapponica baueri]|uniref:Uncharacterized protein n=1 Tax=Limosa lapponica baueri TaxID=1758121 RepID=A0A2I0TJ08_LIMLA|nr:transhypothetical protein [Limosa lapponica baueri]
MSLDLRKAEPRPRGSARLELGLTVADYANSDPAVVKSGRVKKAVANAVQQEGESSLGNLPACFTGLCIMHYSLDAYLPLRLRPESMEKLHCLRACVIRSLYHMYEPFASRVSRNPAIPDSTPSTLKNSRPSLCGTLEPLWCQQKCLPFKDTPIIFGGAAGRTARLKGRTADPWMTSSAP